MFARFVKNVKFFEKSLIQKFLFLCNFKLFLHKINPKLHQTPCQTMVAVSGFELKILLIFLKIIVFAFSQSILNKYSNRIYQYKKERYARLWRFEKTKWH